MTAATLAEATLDDLMKVDGKAELIAGRIVPIIPTGYWPGAIAFRISMALAAWIDVNGKGKVIEDNVGYAFDDPLPSGRQSFSPVSSLYFGDVETKSMRFIDGYPAFAVEVRSKNDYGRAAERDMAEKRADYFVAGTLVVWDVDGIAETVAKYTGDSPDVSTVFTRGRIADAEPAVPGWTLNLDNLFAVKSVSS